MHYFIHFHQDAGLTLEEAVVVFCCTVTGIRDHEGVIRWNQLAWVGRLEIVLETGQILVIVQQCRSSMDENEMCFRITVRSKSKT